MREIKFRGKRVDNGEWIIGNLYTPTRLVKGVYISPDTNYADFAPSFEEGDNFEEEMNKGCALGRFIEVDPSTVGQYTGLKDFNGKEIYEKDIFQTHYGSNYSVEFMQDLSLYSICRPIGKVASYPFLDYDRGVVVGNIHDNPELINQ